MQEIVRLTLEPIVPEPSCENYMREGCEMMRRAEGGDLIVKWWGVVVFVISLIGIAAVAHFRVGLNATDIKAHEGVGMHHEAAENFDGLKERTTRIEERQISIREEMRTGFDRLEQAIKER